MGTSVPFFKENEMGLLSLGGMLLRMHGMPVWDRQGRQYYPVFDYDWKNISHYARAEEASALNIENFTGERDD